MKRWCKKLQHTNDPDQIICLSLQSYKNVNVFLFIFHCFFLLFHNDRKKFCIVLQSACTSIMLQSACLRYVNYCEWALITKKFQEEDTFKHYKYPGEMLNYTCALIPKGDIKGEILEDSFIVSLKEFCEALQIKLL